MTRFAKLTSPLFLALLSCQALPGEGLKGRVFCGYQGWFRAPADGTGSGWRHYAEKGPFQPGNCTIDLWPDVRELPKADRIPTDFNHPDGSVAEVFSSTRASTTDLHFRWMKDYGIDGAFLQRFAVSTKNPKNRAILDQVLLNCRNAAQTHGRSWALMYDLSGLAPGQSQTLISDWRHLNDHIGIKNEAYLTHQNKPLIALWGLGFQDRPAMLAEWKTLIEFFKSDPSHGGCAVMVGVPTYWRTLRRDAIADPALHELLSSVDIISPWSVGRYRTPDAAADHARQTLARDLSWCRERKIELLPVAFPGFSWQNMMRSRGKEAGLNDIPRLGGKFFWSQVWHARKAGAEMLYVAMFDELDEGTAIFKTRSDPPSGKSNFVSEAGIPNDHYLWLTGKAAELFRGGFDPGWSSLPRRRE